VRSGASLDRVKYGSAVALHDGVIRHTVPPTIAGWQLPYLRVALILRRLQAAPPRNAQGQRELANVLRIDAAVRRAGWFN
jgi:hypothetical protein